VLIAVREQSATKNHPSIEIPLMVCLLVPFTTWHALNTNTIRGYPVNFNKEHKAMLGHSKIILEDEPRRIAINPIFDKLITSLRTAVDNDGVLVKERYI